MTATSSEKPALGAIVLAGGYSRRLGQDKAMLAWRGETFLQHICAALSESCQPVVVVARTGQSLAVPPGVFSIADQQPDQGPLMGLATGLAYLHERHIPWAFATTCDAPLIQSALARRLWECAQGADAAIPQVGEQRYGLTAVYRTALASALLERLAAGERRVRDIPEWSTCRLIPWDTLRVADPHSLSLISVNTQAEYKRLLADHRPELPLQESVDVTSVDRALGQLRRLVQEFVSERAWESFHSPKNLAMALAIEVAELMEHFQWLTTEESRHAREDSGRRDAVVEEMADVFCYLLALANEWDVDLAAALVEKMERNRAKYPVDVIRGRYGHHDPQPVRPAPREGE